MVSFLDGPLATAIYNGFKGRLISGVLARTPPSTEVDGNNDPIEQEPVDYAFEGFVDSFSEMFRAQNGIPATDVKILIIAKSIEIEPGNDDKVTFTRSTGNESYQLRKLLEIDPARATYSCQGFKIDGS